MENAIDPDKSPIFVIGMGRSGTTLLRQMLSAHPRIHLTHEAFFYAYAYATPPEVSASEWLERYFRTFSFAWLKLDPEEVRAELPPDLPRERIADTYRAIMRCKARQRGKVRYGEKSPLDSHNLKKVFEDFEDPRVVYIMRDPRATVASLLRVPFTSESVALLSYFTAQQLANAQPYADRILFVKLEDLLEDPRTSMARILDYVGEPWDDAVLDHTAHAPSDDMAPFPWFSGATAHRPRKAATPRWRKELSPEWIRTIEWFNREGMEQFGYGPADLDDEPSVAKRLLAAAGDVPRFVRSSYRGMSWMLRVQGHFSGRREYDPQRCMEDHLGLNPPAWDNYPDFRMPQLPTRP